MHDFVILFRLIIVFSFTNLNSQACLILCFVIYAHVLFLTAWTPHYTQVGPGLIPSAFLVPVNGGWGNWSEWSACIILESMECGNGLTYRNRACDNPAPLFGGIRCPGNSTEADICIIPCKYIGHMVKILWLLCEKNKGVDQPDFLHSPLSCVVVHSLLKV